MAQSTEAPGGRLPLADPETLTGARRDLYETLKTTWVAYAERLGVQAATADGRLIGPFNAMLLHPEVSVKLNEFQASEAKFTTLPPRVRELVIITVGAVWGAEYELYAQAGVVRKLSLPGDTVATLASGGVPEDLGDEEKIAVRLTFELMRRHRAGDELYREAERAFGTTGLFDILAVMGEYQTVCSMMALFEVPVPT